MYPATEAEAVKLAQASDAPGVVICPPYPFLAAVKKTLKKAKLGSQDLFYEPAGAYTGAVSAQELRSLGVVYVIVGHSERRKNFVETDEVIAKKVVAALAADITPILCVGETEAEREAGQAFSVLDRQVKVVLSQLPAGETKGLVICYEPVWAISTNRAAGASPPTAELISQMIAYISGIVGNSGVDASFIYGGSVSSTDLLDYLVVPGISGVLIGAASLKPAEFRAMIHSAFSQK